MNNATQLSTVLCQRWLLLKIEMNHVCPHKSFNKNQAHCLLKTRDCLDHTGFQFRVNLMALHSSTVTPTTASDTGNGLTKTCPQRCDGGVTNPAHPPLPRHTVGGTLPLGMGLLPSPPFAERDKGVVTGGKASQALSYHTNALTANVEVRACVGGCLCEKNIQCQIELYGNSCACICHIWV